MIDQELEENIKYAHFDARRRGLQQVTVEHLVLVLLDNSAVQKLLQQSRADSASLRLTLSSYLGAHTPQNRQAARPMPSESFRRVLKRALERYENKTIGGAHILAAVFSEPDSHAAHCLSKHGVDRLTVIAHLAERPQQPSLAGADSVGGVELVAVAGGGQLEKPFGRAAETDELIRVLSHKYKNNPLLVGDAGVGKTRVVHALAHRIAEGAVPPALRGMKIQNVSLAGLVAGTKYRGDFEQRLQQLLQHCREQENTALFVDEIHTLIGGGAVSGAALDAANILKPALDDSGIRCIGATTSTEFQRIFRKDSALTRRFQKIDIGEPDDVSLATILAGVIERLSAHHNVQYEKTAAASAVQLSRRYLQNRRLPDKAIDLLDDAGARQKLGGNGDLPIGDAELIQVARTVAGVPATTLHDTRRQLAGLAEKLKARVFDQDAAADLLARAVLRARMGFDDGGRAVGAFLFAGPSGVGKTEMARQLAAVLGAPLLRYDMSEYMEMHAVSRLIGAPPGYVGFEQNGRLVEGIAKQPGAVVLFDEIEKAHPDVLNILLQVMDYGVLTDNSGRAADFSNALLVMTTNIGAEVWERPPVGFARGVLEKNGGGKDIAAAGEESLKRLLSPEFRNRLDAIAQFRPLQKTTLRKILNARLSQLTAKIKRDKKATVTIGRRLKNRLLAEGFSQTNGARPLQRLIRETIVDTLTLADIENRLTAGESFTVEEDGGGAVVLTTVKKRNGDSVH